MSLKKNLSIQLKRIREMQKKNIVEFSESLGIAKSTLQRLEAGQANPTLDLIAVIEKNLNLEEGSLLLDPCDRYATILPLLNDIPVLKTLSPENRVAACNLLLELVKLFDEE